MEPKIIASLGALYGPYTGRCFVNRDQTEIEHIIALSEAHDSGLCDADDETRQRFASDLLNLTLASPGVNKRKWHYDAAEWMPPMNRCWFAARVVKVRLKYNLTIDRREADALEQELSACPSTEMTVHSCDVDASVATSLTSQVAQSSGIAEALDLWDDNGDGRITCKEARKHGIAPVPSDHPAYPFMRDADADADGVVCELADTPSASRTVQPSGAVDALSLWDDNGNGRITCKEARKHGIAPVPSDHPAYPFMRDADADGVVCE